MKAISLTQPWATLVAIGAKKWETRDWRVDYRGPLAIHATKSFPAWARELCFEHHFIKALYEADYRVDTLPTGMIVATCQIVACLHTENVLELAKPSPRQRAFGDWSPGRWAWKLEDIVKLPEPIPARGYQGLWEWDNEAAGVHPLVTGTLPGF